MKKRPAGGDTTQPSQEFGKKVEKLEDIIASMRKVVVAYSGGVDSSLLLSLARRILGGDALAVTASSEIIPQKEIEEAKKLAKEIGATHRIIYPNPLENSRFTANDPERCYHCKSGLCSVLEEIRESEGALFVLDGTNMDDLEDYRPGKKAALEWDVRSPLLEAGFTKEDIRRLSRSHGLPAWDRPSNACLASRIPYGQEIAADKLGRIELAEHIISGLGARQIRVRLHDINTARIEVAQDDIELLAGEETRSCIVRELKKLGFIYVTIDLEGYQTGSVNELIGRA
jgi:uncharacterized protein